MGILIMYRQLINAGLSFSTQQQSYDFFFLFAKRNANLSNLSHTYHYHQSLKEVIVKAGAAEGLVEKSQQDVFIARTSCCGIVIKTIT